MTYFLLFTFLGRGTLPGAVIGFPLDPISGLEALDELTSLL